MRPESSQHDNFVTRMLDIQGKVHEALASMRNLENLLKSPRVSPKSLSRAVGSARAEMAPLDKSIAGVIDEVSANQPSLNLTDLRTWAIGRVQLVQDAVESAAKTKMGAASRLKLESVVVPVASDVDGLCSVIMTILACNRAVCSELALPSLTNVALASLAPRRFDRCRLLEVTPIVAASPQAVVYTDARVVIRITAMCLGFLADLGVSRAQLLVSCPSERHATVVVNACGALVGAVEASLCPVKDAKSVNCVAPSLIPHGMKVVVDVASTIGISVSSDISHPWVRIEL